VGVVSKRNRLVQEAPVGIVIVAQESLQVTVPQGHGWIVLGLTKGSLECGISTVRTVLKVGDSRRACARESHRLRKRERDACDGNRHSGQRDRQAIVRRGEGERAET
jgi:hypothetical protein